MDAAYATWQYWEISLQNVPPTTGETEFDHLNDDLVMQYEVEQSKMAYENIQLELKGLGYPGPYQVDFGR